MHTAWSNYGATGEGNTIMIAVARTEPQARELFKAKFDRYYWPGMVVARGIPQEVDGYIPQWVKRGVQGLTGQLCSYHWYGEYHVNCS